MKDKSDFALVPMPSSAVEKVALTANHILSGMVADTLALVKQNSPHKPTFTVLLGLDHFAGMMELILSSKLGETYNLGFFHFARSSELLKLADTQPFDLVFMYIGNITWDTVPVKLKADHANSGAVLGAIKGITGLLVELKARYGKPIIVTQGIDLSAELEPKGITFLNAPFALENFWSRLQPQLGAPVHLKVSRDTTGKPIEQFTHGLPKGLAP